MMEPLTAPLRVVPRLDPKPWAGRRLRRFGFALPSEPPVGEVVATAGAATVADGPLRGRSLQQLAEADPAAVCGGRGLAATGGRPLFPLLVKLIDAGQDLSVQSHPDDATAAPLDSLGKTEAWHILEADAGAAVALGLRRDVSPDEFAAGCRAGRRTAGLLRWLPARPGMTVLLPAGTIHAIGAGCLVYEIQQPSDLTFRLDDWGRVDANGRPREMHIEEGLASYDPGLRPEPIRSLTVSLAGRRQLLAGCRYFALERIALETGEETVVRAADSPQAVTCLNGQIIVESAGGSVSLAAGQTCVLVAALPEGQLNAVGSASVLRAWVPDLEEDIVRPARAEGHPDAAIASLAGPLTDLADALTRRRARPRPR